MTNVLLRTISDLKADSPYSNHHAQPRPTSQITPGSGRHSQYSRTSARLLVSTYVLRSTDGLIQPVNHFLKPRRAMPLCWTAKMPSRIASITTACDTLAATNPRLTVYGTKETSATKAIAYRNARKNTA